MRKEARAPPEQRLVTKVASFETAVKLLRDHHGSEVPQMPAYWTCGCSATNHMKAERCHYCTMKWDSPKPRRRSSSRQKANGRNAQWNPNQDASPVLEGRRELPKPPAPLRQAKVAPQGNAPIAFVPPPPPVPIHSAGSSHHSVGSTEWFHSVKAEIHGDSQSSGLSLPMPPSSLEPSVSTTEAQRALQEQQRLQQEKLQVFMQQFQDLCVSNAMPEQMQKAIHKDVMSAVESGLKSKPLYSQLHVAANHLKSAEKKVQRISTHMQHLKDSWDQYWADMQAYHEKKMVSYSEMMAGFKQQLREARLLEHKAKQDVFKLGVHASSAAIEVSDGEGDDEQEEPSMSSAQRDFPSFPPDWPELDPHEPAMEDSIPGAVEVKMETPTEFQERAQAAVQPPALLDEVNFPKVTAASKGKGKATTNPRISPTRPSKPLFDKKETAKAQQQQHRKGASEAAALSGEQQLFREAMIEAEIP